VAAASPPESQADERLDPAARELDQEACGHGGDRRLTRRDFEEAVKAIHASTLGINRGQRERSFDPELSAVWIDYSHFGLLLKGCEDAGSGEFPRRTVAPLIIRAFERDICSLQ
jgi:hypothetical protein